jgi:5-methylcytosine-specific restriction enzyme subunit McrC
MLQMQTRAVTPSSERWGISVPSPYRHGTWLIASLNQVGAARIGDIEISVEPKVSISRLLFLVGYASHGVTWLSDTVPLDQAEDLIPVVAQALWRQTERAIRQGLLPGYTVVEESSPFLRGRLRESEQLHRHHGLPLPLEIRHDEFTPTSRKTVSCGPRVNGC